MTQVNYHNKINKIMVPELISTFFCFAFVLLILINIQKLNNWYLLTCGIFAALILTVLPILSIRSIRKMRSVNIAGNNYKQSLLEYSKGKMQFLFVQKLSFYLTSILMLVALPVASKLMNGPDVFKETRIWMFYAVGFPIFFLFASWVFKCYRKTAGDAEVILKELEG